MTARLGTTAACARFGVLSLPLLGAALSGVPLLGVLVVCGAACAKKQAPEPSDSPPVIASATAMAPATATVPPVAPTDVSPVSAFADAAPPEDGLPPYEQARAYAESGQYWLARLVLEKKALGSSGTPQELELLAHICNAQSDSACVAECEKKLGKKLKLDAGVPRARADVGEHKEPETDLARARDHMLHSRYAEAREILEPKVLDGKASKEEIRLLQQACKQQGDRMCVALCAAKLK